MREYAGKVVLITGAASGLGWALARAFAGQGARLLLLDRDRAAVEARAAALHAQGAAALGLACDVSEASACQDAIGRGVAAFGGIDVLVNNAGISARCLLRDAVPEVLERVMAVNFFGAVHCTQAALASLRARRGQVIAISSIAGFSPLVGRTAYAASKHALHGFFDSLRSELRADGVDVMLVCPAFMATGIERAALAGDGQPVRTPRHTTGTQATPEQVAQRVLAAARRGRRLCLPAPTARAAWWLSRLAPRVYERLMLRRVGAEFDLSARRAS